MTEKTFHIPPKRVAKRLKADAKKFRQNQKKLKPLQTYRPITLSSAPRPVSGTIRADQIASRTFNTIDLSNPNHQNPLYTTRKNRKKRK
jgi:hypothetical protein